MKQFVVNRFGLIALTIIFLLLYGYFSMSDTLLAPSQQTNQFLPTETPTTIGSLGGFHILEDITNSDERTYYRVAIQTRLNRSTVIDNSIITPKTDVELVPADEEILIEGRLTDTTDLGPYRIQATLSDTQVVNTPGATLEGMQQAKINQGPLTEVWLIQSPEDSNPQILIGLTEIVRFRVSANSAGTIFIDILK